MALEQIEKGIPIPARKKKYQFEKMEIGDSILIKGSRETRELARIAAAMHGKRHGKKFTCKSTRDGLRIWRIENDADEATSKDENESD